MNFQRISQGWLAEKHSIDIAAEIFGLSLRERNVQIYLSLDEERWGRQATAVFDRDVVILHTTSRCSANHQWESDRWAELVRRSPQYTFVQLGHADEAPVTGAADWRGRTTLRQFFAFAKFATTFVSVESCMGHVGNAFDLPGVVLFGDSSPRHWGHNTNLNIYTQVPCSPCYQLLRGSTCPYDRECMHSIGVEEVEAALARQVERGRERLTAMGLVRQKPPLRSEGSLNATADQTR